MTQYVQERVASMERPVTVWVLIAMLAGLILSYGYFVNGAIVNIVATKDMQSKIASLTSSVGDLEASYLAAKSSITLDYAHTLGFAEVKSGASTYLAKRPADSLTFNR